MSDHGTVTQMLERRQVPVYVGGMGVGALVGLATPTAAAVLEHTINLTIAALLYVTFLQVPVANVGTALRDTRFMAVLFGVNFLVVPAVVAVLYPLLPGDRAIRAGVLLVLLCPCVDYVIVFSGLAGGDNRRLLAATPVLLILQMALLPVFLTAFMGAEVADLVDISPFVTSFVVLIVVPLALAWGTQMLAVRSAPAQRFRGGIDVAMVPLMTVVLAVVVASQIHTLDDHGREVARLIPVYAMFLAVMAILGLLIARLARIDLAGRRAIAFSGATRNSLVVLPLALSLPPSLELAASAVVTQTLVEVLGMVALVAIIPRTTR
ncbi:arsenic resistance protein [Gordonia hankookensis]|uniref:Arsenic resistance protein n=2 Tax=Gordonia hankookensis TaxID=589403 RepID=A0ABR7WJV0_9ACTN|nr:bile acid:sodium symporter [Gordonia hankookensis]MBD1322064.1 arsenic resistance protein [Gordonia hankookensis]